MSEPKQAASAGCPWATTELSIAYHDHEWGLPSHDDRHLFEMITLEGAQAGLSWETILRKREGYREAFANFDPATVARFTSADVDRLVLNPAIVRHRGKIESTVQNAKAVLAAQAAHGSLDSWLWSFLDHTPIQHQRQSIKDLPAETDLSKTLSKAMKEAGFRFVGSTTCYAFMQAVGMVNDHVVSCPRHKACSMSPKK